MPLVIDDRVRETTTVTGTNDATLLGAVTGFQAFSVIGNGNTTYYTISDQSGGNWEVGLGTFSSVGPTLARTTVLSSSAGGAKVSFPAGTKDVFVTYPSEKAVYLDASGNAQPALGNIVTSQVNITAQGDLRLEDTTGGQYVALQAPGTIATSYTLTLPVDDGTNGQALITDGNGVLSWSTAASGDVYGPASATDNAIARFDLTTGKIIQNSVVTIADTTGDMAGVGTLSSGAITTTGVLTVPAGSVSAPAITTTGDTNTGIFFPAADTIAFTEGGAESMRINSVGNLGIGTSSPTAVGSSKVVEIGATTGNSAFQLFSVAGSLKGFMYASDTETSIGSIPAIPLSFKTNDTERVRIDASGNVRLIIGNLYTPTTSGIWFSGAVGSFTEGIYGAGSNAVAINANGSERMRITSAGNVGIGTSSPGTLLDVSSTGNTQTRVISGATNLAFTRFTNGTQVTTVGQESSTGGSLAVGSTAYSSIFGTNALYSLHLVTNNTVQATINSAGNVGIGTTSPAAKVEISVASPTTGIIQKLFATGATGAQLHFAQSGVADWVVGQPPNVNALSFYSDRYSGNAGVERMRIDSAGNVGIGTTAPGTTLNLRFAAGAGGPQIRFDQVSDNPYMEFDRWTGSGSNYNAGRIYVDGASSGLIFASATTDAPIGSHTFVERMRINSAGNVGIGTSSPSARLSVLEAITIPAVSTASASLEIGTGRSGNGFCFIDLIGDTTYSDFGLRIIRGNTGANAETTLSHRGTGNFTINSVEAAPITFNTTSTERMRIDSSGNVLVGTTNADPITAQVDGISLGSDKIIRSSVNSVPCAAFARRGTDGAIINLIKGTTEVGSIRVGSTGVTYNGTNGIVFTATQTASADANTLDDYEEGTWSPTLRTDGTNFTSVTYGAQNGAVYVKIGKQVTIRGTLSVTAVTIGSATGGVQIGNIPFKNMAGGLAGPSNGGGVANSAAGWTTNAPMLVLTNYDSSVLSLARVDTNGTVTGIAVSNVSTGTNSVSFSLTYFTD